MPKIDILLGGHYTVSFKMEYRVGHRPRHQFYQDAYNTELLSKWIKEFIQTKNIPDQKFH